MLGLRRINCRSAQRADPTHRSFGRDTWPRAFPPFAGQCAPTNKIEVGTHGPVRPQKLSAGFMPAGEVSLQTAFGILPMSFPVAHAKLRLMPNHRLQMADFLGRRYHMALRQSLSFERET